MTQPKSEWLGVPAAFMRFREEHPEKSLREVAVLFWNTHADFAAYRADWLQSVGHRRMLNVYGYTQSYDSLRVEGYLGGCPLLPSCRPDDFYVLDGRVIESGDTAWCGRCRHQLTCALAGGPTAGQRHFEELV